MSELTPDQLTSHLEASLADIQDAIVRGLGSDVTVSLGAHSPLDQESTPDEWIQSGLVLGWKAGEIGFLMVLPESSTWVPPLEAEGDWSDTVRNRLQSLAQELAFLTDISESMSDTGYAVLAPSMVGSVQTAEPPKNASYLALELASEDSKAMAHLIWPVAEPAAINQMDDDPEASGNSAEEAQATSEAQTTSEADSQDAPASTDPQPVETSTSEASSPNPTNFSQGLELLPPYGRSLLRIKVPIIVTLAQKKENVEKIVNVVPGSIIQFDKSCEEMLELTVNNHKIAVGEAVKVDEKFGLRICQIAERDERFHAVQNKAS